MWGKSLLVTPVLDPEVDYVDGYFPEGLWYDYYTVRLWTVVLYCAGRLEPIAYIIRVPFTSQGDCVSSKGEELRLNAPLDKINLHLREGSIIPTQVKQNVH